MIPNRYTPETIHVANWFLASGQGALLLKGARHTVYTNGLCEDDVADTLANLLHDRFLEVVDTAIPGSHSFSVDEMPDVHLVGDDDYGEGIPELLILPLLGQSAHRISFDDVAELILDHVPAAA